VDGSDRAPPCGLLGLSLRVVEPECPGVLERVRRGLERRGGRGGVVGDLAVLPVVVVRRGAAPGACGRGPGVGLLGHGGGVRMRRRLSFFGRRLPLLAFSLVRREAERCVVGRGKKKKKGTCDLGCYGLGQSSQPSKKRKRIYLFGL
jgi:hypothetical protein